MEQDAFAIDIAAGKERFYAGSTYLHEVPGRSLPAGQSDQPRVKNRCDKRGDVQSKRGAVPIGGTLQFG